MLNGPYKQTFSDKIRHFQTKTDVFRHFQTKTDVSRQKKQTFSDCQIFGKITRSREHKI